MNSEHGNFSLQLPITTSLTQQTLKKYMLKSLNYWQLCFDYINLHDLYWVECNIVHLKDAKHYMS